MLWGDRWAHLVDSATIMRRQLVVATPSASGRRSGWGPGRWGVAHGLICTGLVAVLGASQAAAQPGPPPLPPPPSRPPRLGMIGLLSSGPRPVATSLLDHARGGTSLRQRVGLRRAERLLQSSALGERLRGIERLATIGSSEAVDLLVDALAPGHAVRVNPQSRLQAVRALAAHLDTDGARSALVSVLHAGRADAAELPLEGLARDTAAMALARTGNRQALAPLVAAIVGGGRAGARARRAILARPPADLRALIGKRQSRKTEKTKKKVSLSPRLLALLGELGDQRAVPLLRRHLAGKTLREQRAAALALARLGDGSCESKARTWLRAPPKAATTRSTGAEVLVLLGAPDAPKAVAMLLSSPATRAAGLELAQRAPAASLAKPLRAIVEQPDADPAERRQALAALARCGGGRAVSALVAALGRPNTATQAALGLARAPGSSGRDALGRALQSAPAGPARRLVLRAGLVRFAERGESIVGLDAALSVALGAKAPADRAVGAFGSALMGLRPVSQLLESSDPVVAAAAARAALGLGPHGLAHCRAVDEAAEAMVPCGAALLVPGGHQAASSTLARWAEDGGPLAPVAAAALGGRDSEGYRSRLRRLLGGTDPLVRAAAALGLGRSPRPDAASLLAGAYRFEPERRVRRAVVRALSGRTEPQRLRILQLARDLDPDPEVRALARSALLGKTLGLTPPPGGSDVLWLVLQPNRPSELPRAAGRAVLVVRGDGLALPVLAAPDGVLLVPGLARSGALSVRLAAAAVSGDALER